jgi:hypothetical protein
MEVLLGIPLQLTSLHATLPTPSRALGASRRVGRPEQAIRPSSVPERLGRPSRQRLQEDVSIYLRHFDLEVTPSRAYNDMLYLCEKYAPLGSLERYQPENDISVTGAYVQHKTHNMRDALLANIPESEKSADERGKVNA